MSPPRGIGDPSFRVDDYTNNVSSVKLCCLSPVGRSIHCLAIRNSVAYIESHNLPLPGSVEDPRNDQASDGTIPDVVRTRLPPRVQAALSRYPPLELFCVDVDDPSTINSNNKSRELRKIPLLCLYTKRDVFVLDLAYSPANGARELDGEVLAVKEPFDDVLLGTATSTNIIRIRPAPQRRSGFATMCPPESMAMLTHDTVTNEYSLVVFHGSNSGAVGTPLIYGMEHLEDQDEKITDFCFCRSNAFGLLASLSIALVKGSGDVLFASPILFRGTVVPRLMVANTLEFLEYSLKESKPDTARWRQFRTAKQFLIDAFPDDGTSHFITAQVRSPAFEWPVQVQGPMLIAPESDDFETLVTAIEPIPAGDLVGLVIGHLGDMVDFGLLSPTIMIPRFKFESEEDTLQLDEELKWGTIVQRVDMGVAESEHQPMNASLALVPDPVMDTVVHYVTPSNIMSISTNAVKLASRTIREQAGSGGIFSPPSGRKESSPRTTAWSCLDVAGSMKEVMYLTGAVVSGDAHLGHVLVSRLSNGKGIAL